MEYLLVTGALAGMGYLLSDNNKTNESFQDNNISFIKKPDSNVQKEVIPCPKENQTMWQENVSKDNFVSLDGTIKNVDNVKNKTKNMIASFGGKRTQNNFKDKGTYDVNRSRLDLFTGSSKCQRRKKEIKPMFKPQNNRIGIGSTHARDINVNLEDRYIPSNKKKSELPFKQIRVAPGLNKGYVSKGTGGFHDLNARDYSIPKNTDEIRTLNNPKKTYEGRVLPPKKIDKRGKMGKLYKHRPETFYKNSPKRYFTTTGSVLKETTRPTHILKETNRTYSKEYIGSVAPNANVKQKVRAKVAKSRKQQLESDTKRNVRRVLKALVAPLQDVLKPTKKENFVGNIRPCGTLNINIPNKMTVYDPNDVARTTIKETLIHDAVRLNLNEAGPKKQTVYDPNDIARRTIKETTIYNNRTGNVTGLESSDGYSVANYKAKTTTRETTLSGYSGNPGYNEGMGYLTATTEAPNTNRQFTCNNEYTGIAGDGVGAQMSQENMCNARLNVNKEKIAKGRPPTQNNVKLVSGEESMNIHIRKNECDRVNQRGPTGIKLPYKIPSLDNCALTELKTEHKEDNRLDPVLLNSLKDNPYALRILGAKQ